MTWETFPSNDGIYYVSWDGVARILRSYVRSKATLENSKINIESHIIGPDVYTIDVNWDAVRAQTDSQSEYLLADFYQASKCSMQTQVSRLHDMIAKTRRNSADFQNKMHNAQRQTMANIDKSVSRAETGLTIARATRDFSAEFLMVGATFVSGGTAAPLLAIAGGSGLKSAAKYEDSSHPDIKEAGVTFVAEFAMGVIDLGAGKGIDHLAENAFKEAVGTKLEKEAAKRSTQLALAILYSKTKGAALEPAKAVIEGDTLQKGFATGAFKAIGGTYGELLKYFLLDPKMQKSAALVGTLLSVAADRISDKLTEPNGNEKTGPPKMARPATPKHALLDAAVYDWKTIEQIAIRKIGSAGSSGQPSWQHVRAAAGLKK